MQQEIKYKGFSASPSDYDCLDGDLAYALNVIPERGALRPIAPSAEEMNFSALRPSGVWVHETTSFKHYIYHFSTALYYRVMVDATTGDYEEYKICEIGNVSTHNLDILGNTLILSTSAGMFYILWDNENREYVALGSNLPECPISFGLQGMEVQGGEFVADTSSDQAYTESLYAEINKFIANESVNKGKFMFPFLVRYAYRLYDGRTLTRHSAPILMMPTTTQALVCSYDGTEVFLTSIAARLDYKSLLTWYAFTELKKWKDIIKSVDIFISTPIYTHNQEGVFVRNNYRLLSDVDSCFVGKADGETEYKIHNLRDFVDSGYGDTCIPLPISETPAETKVAECSHFYFIKSIPIESIGFDDGEERTVIYIPDDYLQSLATREMMTDDYQTHDIITGKHTQVYNNRLNIANVTRIPFNGYNLASMVCFRNEALAYDATPTVYLPTDHGVSKLQGETVSSLTLDMNTFSYLYYPDATAIGMEIAFEIDGEIRLRKAYFTPHNFLNGAVHFDKFPTSTRDYDNQGGIVVGVQTSSNASFAYPNKIYTSEANNPFYFPVTNINTISTGEVFGIRSAAKALSEGQFGQFPLYAFTTEGVWALTVNNNGGYNAVQPIIEDVCLSSKSIVQMDSSVAFASQRGIMILSGSNAVCISDILMSERPFQVESLPHCEDFVTAYDMIPFREFLKNSILIWDYYNQRLIVSSAAQYSYVFSLESKSWGIFGEGNFRAVRSYPEALVLDGDDILRNLSKPVYNSAVNVCAISRPIKGNYADALKQITTVIQRGEFMKGNVRSVLYGSRDLYNWHLIASSKDHYIRGFRGSPYKYFRVCVVGELSLHESISGCTMEVNLKQTNQIR